MRRIQFTLRTWFTLLTIATIAAVAWRYVQRRQDLQRVIIQEATLLYDGSKRNAQTTTVHSTALGTFTSSPHPFVTLRDSKLFPWASKRSKGWVAFCAFDRFEHHHTPLIWWNDILATGELRRLHLRQLRNDSLGESDLKALGERNHNLEELFLSANSPDRVDLGASLQGIERLRKLQTLEFYAVDADYLSSMPRGLPKSLKHVSLVDCGLATADIAILANCRSIESLNLASNQAELKPLLKSGLPSTLKKINLTKTRVTKDDLHGLRNCHQLDELKLSGAEIDLRNAESLRLPKSLVILELGAAILDASSFLMIQDLPNLERLVLTGASFEDEHLEGIRLATKLKSVEVGGTNAAIHFSNSLSSAVNLESLNLYGNDIGDESLLALGAKPGLKLLLLNSKRITDKSAIWLKELTKLRRLELCNSSVTDELFSVAPHLKRVDDLRLEGSPVSQSLKDEIRAIANERYREHQARIGQMRNRVPTTAP